MDYLTRTYRVPKWITSIALFLFFLSLGITFVIFFEPMYHWSISWFGVEKLTGYSADTLKMNYHELIGYLTNPLVDALKMTDFPSSEQGLFHFFEVKRLFFVNFAVLLASGLISFFGVRYLRQRRQTWQLRRPIRWLVLIPVVVCFAIAAFFDTLFVKFHQVFFNNDAWMFDPKNDPIILALPEEFFMLCFAVVFTFLLAGLLGTNVAIKRLKEI